MKTLHILNGDATLHPFSAANLAENADIIVWREMLSEGPVKDTDNLSELWDLRCTWIDQDIKQKGPGGYREMVVQEYEKFALAINTQAYDEVVFWFEHDLFCQINLVFLLAQLAGKAQNQTVSLISIDHHPDLPDFKGLGQLSSAQLATLFLQRQPITADDVAKAAAVWKAYAGPDPMAIQELLNEPFGGLTFLKDALQAHLQRFPFVGNHLNLIELQLLTILVEGPMREEEFIRRFLHQDQVYGLTEWGVEQYIIDLQPNLLHRIDNKVELTPEGTDIATGRQQYHTVHRWLGGYEQTSNSPYRWDNEQQKLIHL
ncbi:DUF1835 domain-containing protein [Tellurirhabdus bombi]|uniref:DUF1835 domain-containing protein n=1 Tax=Tellurirhabdus bombi TaxID=2907205 RepID=UPI001F1741A6|nr:DUF1835 domain-containing protein [Tellurirhabdus bombi]